MLMPARDVARMKRRSKRWVVPSNVAKTPPCAPQAAPGPAFAFALSAAVFALPRASLRKTAFYGREHFPDSERHSNGQNKPPDPAGFAAQR